MKIQHVLIYSIGILYSVIVCSCTEFLDVPYNEQDSDKKTECLKISVSTTNLEDYVDGVQTRAAYSGDNVTFQKGDALGLTLYKNDGTVVYDNIKFTYNGTEWLSDTPITRLNGATKYTASFPYKDVFNGKKTSAELLAASPLPKNGDGVIQIKDLNAYKQADIMAETEQTASYNLNIKLSHLRACISVNVPKGIWYEFYDAWGGGDGKKDISDYGQFCLYNSNKTQLLGYGYKMDDIHKILIDPVVNQDDYYVGMLEKQRKYFDINNRSKTFSAGCRYHHNQTVESHQFSWKDLRIGDAVIKYNGNFYALPDDVTAVPPNWTYRSYFKDFGYVFSKFTDGSYIYFDIYYSKGKSDHLDTPGNAQVDALSPYYLRNSVSGVKNPTWNIYQYINQVGDAQTPTGDELVNLMKNAATNMTGVNQFNNALNELRTKYTITATGVTTVTPWYVPTPADIRNLRKTGLPSFSFFVASVRDATLDTGLFRFNPGTGQFEGFKYESVDKGDCQYFTRIRVKL